MLLKAITLFRPEECPDAERLAQYHETQLRSMQNKLLGLARRYIDVLRPPHAKVDQPPVRGHYEARLTVLSDEDVDRIAHELQLLIGEVPYRRESAAKISANAILRILKS